MARDRRPSEASFGIGGLRLLRILCEGSDPLDLVRSRSKAINFVQQRRHARLVALSLGRYSHDDADAGTAG